MRNVSCQAALLLRGFLPSALQQCAHNQCLLRHVRAIACGLPARDSYVDSAATFDLAAIVPHVSRLGRTLFRCLLAVPTSLSSGRRRLKSLRCLANPVQAASAGEVGVLL
eukprot:6477754-Amphidinium_carterae.2